MNNLHTFVVLAYKESKYLEDCVKSVLDQEYKSKVVIATTTDNKFIRNIADKYQLEVVVGKHTNIGGDFDFAVNCGESPLVTVAHQDDIYDRSYSKRMVDHYIKYNDAVIIYSDYYEIRGEDKVYSNINLVIKRILLFPLRIKSLSKYKFVKRFALRFGNGISCPAVTFVKDNVPNPVFQHGFRSNEDWEAWEMISKLDGEFLYSKNVGMYHRIHEGSETSIIIGDNARTTEDLVMFRKFWPEPIAKLIAGVYASSEKSNEL